MEGASWQLDESSLTRLRVFMRASSRSRPSCKISSVKVPINGPPSPTGPSSAVFPEVVENTTMEFSTSHTMEQISRSLCTPRALEGWLRIDQKSLRQQSSTKIVGSDALRASARRCRTKSKLTQRRCTDCTKSSWLL